MDRGKQLKRYLFDVEADGLLDQATVIHSLVIRDLDSDSMISCTSHPQYEPDAMRGLVDLESGLRLIEEADELWAHNGQNYDYALIRKLHPWWSPKGRLLDSLRCTRLMFPNIKEQDLRDAKRGRMPAVHAGSHSLEAWGYRLGVRKGTFGKTNDFSKWTPEMQTYCEQDVVVLKKLVQHIKAQGPEWDTSIELEHQFGAVIEMMCRGGVGFDVQSALDLQALLEKDREELKGPLQVAFPPKEVVTVSPKKQTRKGKQVPFNPNSRQQIAERLKQLGWEPTPEEDGSSPSIDEDLLESLPYPEAQTLAKYLLVQKRMGQLATGSQALLKHERSGRIHGSVNTNGAVTGRCTHSSPNLAQVPKNKKPYGKQFRGLFKPYTPGYVMVGCDASGLELRCFAHFLARYDGGEYANVVVDGDVHTKNQLAFGLPEAPEYRDPAKNGGYAVLYGAGDYKFGITLFPHLGVPGREAEAIAAGKRARAAFKKNVPAYAKLIADVEQCVVTRKFLYGMDRRKLFVRSKHAALNTVLQSCGALLVKKATILAAPTWAQHGAHLMLHIHDEVQIEAPPEHAKVCGQAFVEALKEAGRQWNFRCRLDGEYKVGASWSDTH